MPRGFLPLNSCSRSSWGVSFLAGAALLEDEGRAGGPSLGAAFFLVAGGAAGADSSRGLVGGLPLLAGGPTLGGGAGLGVVDGGRPRPLLGWSVSGLGTGLGL